MTSAVLILALGGVSQLFHHKAEAAYATPQAPGKVAPAKKAPKIQDCSGTNDCKGLGGCKTDSHSCKGQNDCKGQGGCKG